MCFTSWEIWYVCLSEAPESRQSATRLYPITSRSSTSAPRVIAISTASCPSPSPVNGRHPGSGHVPIRDDLRGPPLAQVQSHSDTVRPTPIRAHHHHQSTKWARSPPGPFEFSWRSQLDQLDASQHITPLVADDHRFCCIVDAFEPPGPRRWLSAVHLKAQGFCLYGVSTTTLVTRLLDAASRFESLRTRPSHLYPALNL
jgi:hypothetical protein